jgi:hypothetical protein
MPTKASIVTRQQTSSTIASNNLGKGQPLSFEDIDSTLLNLRDSSHGIAGDTGSVDIQQGDTLTVAGGTGISTSLNGSTLTIEGTSQAQGITVQAPDSSQVAVSDGGTLQLSGAGGISIGTTGGVITVDATTINNAINIDGGTANSSYGGTSAINGGTSA